MAALGNSWKFDDGSIPGCVICVSSTFMATALFGVFSSERLFIFWVEHHVFWVGKIMKDLLQLSSVPFSDWSHYDLDCICTVKLM